MNDERQDNAVVFLSEAHRQLELATTAEEIKPLRDKALTIAQYLKRIHGSQEIAIDAMLYVFDCQRKAGEWLKDNVQHEGGNPQLFQNGTVRTLPEGLDRKDSMRWQQQAQVDEEQYVSWREELRSEAKERNKAPSQAELMRFVCAKCVPPEKPQPTFPTTATYRTIVIDPPWPMEKILRDVAPAQLEMPYRSMSLEEIADFDLSAFAAPDGCHLYLWTTHKHLPDAFGILEAWDFRYICAMVWHKPGGFQPFGLPQYNCEFVLFARHGGLQFNDTKDFFCCFNAERGSHSEKPTAFYDIVRRVSPEPRVDIFGRRTIEGFDSWGDEAPEQLRTTAQMVGSVPDTD